MKVQDESLIGLILEAASRLREWTGPSKSTPGSMALSRVRLATLKFVAEQGRVTMKDLAAHLRVTPPTATLLADALAAKGLVRREVGPKDRRSVRLAVTAKGKKALKVGCREMLARVQTLVTRLNGDERGQLKRMLSRLLALTS